MSLERKTRTVQTDSEFKKEAVETIAKLQNPAMLRRLIGAAKDDIARNAHLCQSVNGSTTIYRYKGAVCAGIQSFSIIFIVDPADDNYIKLCSLVVELDDDLLNS